MRVWLAAAWAAWVTLAVSAECPAECRCMYDSDGLWEGECAPSILSSSPLLPPAPLEALRIKTTTVPRFKTSRINPGTLTTRFVDLHALRLAHAGITAIPPNSFNGLNVLNLIDLSSNRLRSLRGSAFLGLPALRTIILRGNAFLILSPTDPLRSESLRELDLGHCGLLDLPKLDHLPALRRLALDGNYLKSFDPFALPQALRTLDLAGNSVATVPQDLQKLRHLRLVDLGDNPVICTCELLILHDWLSGKGAMLEAVCAGPLAVTSQPLAQVDEDALCRGELGEPMLGDQPADTETLFVNAETRRMGTHMEVARPSEWAESNEASGDGFESVDDSFISTHDSMEWEGSGEVSENVSTKRNYSEDFLSSTIDEDRFGAMRMNETAESFSSTETEEESTAMMDSDIVTDESPSVSSSTEETSQSNLTDEFPSVIISTEEFLSTTTNISTLEQLLASSTEESFSTSSETTEYYLPSTTEESVSSSSTTENEGSSTEGFTISSSTQEFLPETVSSTPLAASSTPKVFLVPNTTENFEVAFAAGSAEEVEGATETAAAGVNEDDGWGALLISAAVVGPLAVLGAAAAWRRRRRTTPRKMRLQGGPPVTSNGAELQDMGPLLPQQHQPVQLLPPEERPLTNGAAPVRATARLTVLPDSVPRTPVFIHKTS